MNHRTSVHPTPICEKTELLQWYNKCQSLSVDVVNGTKAESKVRCREGEVHCSSVLDVLNRSLTVLSGSALGSAQDHNSWENTRRSTLGPSSVYYISIAAVYPVVLGIPIHTEQYNTQTHTHAHTQVRTYVYTHTHTHTHFQTMFVCQICYKIFDEQTFTQTHLCECFCVCVCLCLSMCLCARKHIHTLQMHMQAKHQSQTKEIWHYMHRNPYKHTRMHTHAHKHIQACANTHTLSEKESAVLFLTIIIIIINNMKRSGACRDCFHEELMLMLCLNSCHLLDREMWPVTGRRFTKCLNSQILTRALQ